MTNESPTRAINCQRQWRTFVISSLVHKPQIEYNKLWTCKISNLSYSYSVKCQTPKTWLLSVWLQLVSWKPTMFLRQLQSKVLRQFVRYQCCQRNQCSAACWIQSHCYCKCFITFLHTQPMYQLCSYSDVSRKETNFPSTLYLLWELLSFQDGRIKSWSLPRTCSHRLLPTLCFPTPL